MTIVEYIEKNFDGSRKKFADALGVHKQQVTRWINEGFIVVDGQLFSPRRQLDDGHKDV